MNRQELNIERALKNQAAIQAFKVSEAYALLITPLLEEVNKLKVAYDCKTLAEMAALKGKREGLTFLPDLLDHYDQEGTRAQEAALKIETKKKLEQIEFDSTDL